MMNLLLSSIPTDWLATWNDIILLELEFLWFDDPEIAQRRDRKSFFRCGILSVGCYSIQVVPMKR